MIFSGKQNLKIVCSLQLLRHLAISKNKISSFVTYIEIFCKINNVHSYAFVSNFFPRENEKKIVKENTPSVQHFF